MGLIKAAGDAISGTMADQWKDFLTVPSDIWPTAAIFPAVKNGTNANRGSNLKSSDAIISNGSRIVVPEGYGLLVLQDGALIAFSNESGAYTWDSSDLNSQSIFAGDSFWRAIVSQSWDRFKTGGRPNSQQVALFVRLQELPNNKFGTKSEIYWDDAYLNAQVGAIAHGTYSITVIDPIKFAMAFVPASYLQGADVFDFTDDTNPNAMQLLAEVVGSLAATFSEYANDANKGNRIAKLQQDTAGFAKALGETVEKNYEWATSRGLAISKAAIIGIQYDATTKELLKKVQQADALLGARGNSNLQASVALGIQAAGENTGASGILGVGIAGGSVGLSGLMQNASETNRDSSATGEPDLVANLEKLKQALDAGLITQSDFDAAKAKALGLS